ncbi:MAG: RHS repeat protein, partial [Burkholderiales bacterium]
MSFFRCLAIVLAALLFALCARTSAEAGAIRQTGWTPFDQPATETDSLHRTTTHTYSARAERTATAYPDGATEQNAYDAAGRLISSTDPRGGKTTYAYDAAGRKTTSTDPLGQITRYAYNEVNDLVEV